MKTRVVEVGGDKTLVESVVDTHTHVCGRQTDTRSGYDIASLTCYDFVKPPAKSLI